MDISSFLGRVVRILSTTTLIIDVGSSRVSVGDKIQVFDIIDNVVGIEGEDLGPLTYIKAELRVVRAEDNYSICETPTRRVNENPVFASIFSSPSTKEHYPLNVDSTAIDPMGDVDDKIHIGDYVKLAK